MDINSVIIRPVITEQSMGLVDKGKFTFGVDRAADKRQIKQAVEKEFNVHVTDVVTIVMKGKSRRVGPRRIEKKYSPWKKAVVRLKKGEKIDLFDTNKK